MTIANLASEMGAKNCVFPPDEVLKAFLETDTTSPAEGFHGEDKAVSAGASEVSEPGSRNSIPEITSEHDALYGSGNSPFGIWADPDARYVKEITLDLASLFPVVSAPHQVDNVKAVDEVAGTPIQQALIGTCTNGRLSDLQVAAGILREGKSPPACSFR